MVQNIMTVSDFDSILDNYAGRQVWHISVTQTTSNISGQETLTDGAGTAIKAYFMRTGQNWDYMKAGFLEKGDAVALTKYASSVKINDKIYADGVGLTITSIDGDATTISITTSAAHGISVADSIIIISTTNYDGVYTVATVPTSTTLTITDSSHDLAAETSGGIIRDYSQFRVKQSFDVPGVFDSTGSGTEYAYTSCNLFLLTDPT